MLEILFTYNIVTTVFQHRNLVILKFTHFSHQPFLGKLDTSLYTLLYNIECSFNKPKNYWNKWEKAVEILFRNVKVTTILQLYPWKCAVDPLITFEIPQNFLIWDVCKCCETLWKFHVILGGAAFVIGYHKKNKKLISCVYSSRSSSFSFSNCTRYLLCLFVTF